MLDATFRALDAYQLLPRLLGGVHEVSTAATVGGLELAAPLLPRLAPPLEGTWDAPGLLSADWLLEQPETFPFERAVALLEPRKMGELMPQVRKLAAREVAALALDLGPLADTPPFGARAWHPRSREDLAELAAAAGAPLWLCGVASPADAEVAAEAGVDAIVVGSGAGAQLGTPSALELFPEIFDAVAGMTALFAQGPVRHGVDVFRYLAIGAEALVVEGERPLAKLQAELAYAMRLTGCETLADIGYDAIFAPLFGEAP